LANDPGYFAWYELMTTDVAAAATFYRNVVSWGTREASSSNLPYMLFTADEVPTAGLIELPEEGRKLGATPRWTGYIGVRDVNVAADRIKRRGGAVYVPPTDTNIGRISVVADTHAATFGVIERTQAAPQQAANSGKPGRIGWQELFATDLAKEVAFYCELFGWQKADTDNHLTAAYVSLSAGGQVIGGAFKNPTENAPPFWLFYFNVDDLDGAAERVRAGGGQASLNDEELPGGLWIAHCVDPHGAAFSLQGKKGHAPKVGWSTEWQGFSSRGQLVAPKPKRESGH
jgi:uncharacterized protein